MTRRKKRTTAVGRFGAMSAILGVILMVLSGGMLATASATENQNISAQALTDHECDSTEWHFVITQVDEEANAPDSINVTWENGASQDVPLDRVTGGVAHYATTSNLDSTVTSATASIYSGWSGQFNLSHGPCGDKVVTPAKPGATTPSCEMPNMTVTPSNQEGVVWSPSGPTTLTPGQSVTYTATPAQGSVFPDNAQTSWTYTNTLDVEECDDEEQEPAAMMATSEGCVEKGEETGVINVLVINPESNTKTGTFDIFIDEVKVDTVTLAPGEESDKDYDGYAAGTHKVLVTGDFGTNESSSPVVKECETQDEETYDICHATGSGKYVLIPNISASGIFNGHYGEGRGDHQDGNDIIPPFEYEGQTYSQNWDAAGQAIYKDGCKTQEEEPEGNLTVSSTCESITFSGSGVKPEGATVTFKLDGVDKAAGTYSVTPGSHTVEMFVNGEKVDSETVMVEECEEEDKEVTPAKPGATTPSCEMPNMTVTPSNQEGVVWSPSGSTVLQPGQSVTYTATPADSYVFPQGAQTSWTYTNTFDVEECDDDEECPPGTTWSDTNNNGEVDEGECVPVEPPCVDNLQDEDPNADCYVERDDVVVTDSSVRDGCDIGGVETTNSVMTTSFEFIEETQEWVSETVGVSSVSFDPYTAAELEALGCDKEPPTDDQCPDGSNPGDVNGDGMANSEDCTSDTPNTPVNPVTPVVPTSVDAGLVSAPSVMTEQGSSNSYNLALTTLVMGFGLLLLGMGMRHTA